MVTKRHKCGYKYCTPIKIQARSAKLGSKLLHIEIGTLTLFVKVQVMATADLLRENMVKSLGCKIRKNIYNYQITSADKKPLKIGGITTIIRKSHL